MNRRVISLCVAAALMGAGSMAMAGGDAAAGKKKAVTCAGCHGAAGKAENPIWPNLAGQNDAYIVKQLKAFRSGDRKDNLMTPMAKPLNDKDIDNLAAHFSSLK